MQPEFRVIRFNGSLNNRYEAAQTPLSSFSFPTRSCTLWHGPPRRFFLSLLFIRAPLAKSFYPFLHLLTSSTLLPSPVESVYFNDHHPWRFSSAFHSVLRSNTVLCELPRFSIFHRLLVSLLVLLSSNFRFAAILRWNPTIFRTTETLVDMQLCYRRLSLG